MRRDLNDFSLVRPEHIAIHERLLNWGRWSTPSRGGSNVHPMFRAYRHGREEASGSTTNTGDALALERLMRFLPKKNVDALTWAYVYPYIPVRKVRQVLGVTEAALLDLVNVGRTMLKNRSA